MVQVDGAAADHVHAVDGGAQCVHVGRADVHLGLREMITAHATQYAWSIGAHALGELVSLHVRGPCSDTEQHPSPMHNQCGLVCQATPKHHGAPCRWG